jgi:hypothetical protein
LRLSVLVAFEQSGEMLAAVQLWMMRAISSRTRKINFWLRSEGWELESRKPLILSFAHLVKELHMSPFGRDSRSCTTV